MRLAEEGKTPLWIAIDGRLAGIISVADTIKPTSITAIRQMHAEGLRVVMLTGDNKLTANSIAREAGVDLGGRRVIKKRKVDANQRQQLAGREVEMARGGVHACPALAEQDVG